MSLFGDEDRPSRGQSSLFDDTPANKSAERGLFGDDADPWIPSPKKRKDPSQLLVNSDIPDQYIDIFDSYAHNGAISLATFRDLLADAQLAEHDKESIVAIVFPGESSSAGLSRGLTNVALVLIALAQRGEDLSIDAVDDRKAKALPLPKLAARKSPVVDSEIASKSAVQPPSSLAEPLEQQQSTLDAFVTKTSRPNSTYTPHADSPVKSASVRRDEVGDPWSPNGSTSHTPLYEATAQETSNQRYGSNPTFQSPLLLDSIVIRALEGREGMPLWKHINYEVKSSKRKSSVVRRYSDFAWLLECLLKKYPFRQIPLLPPKRLAGMNLTVNGVHLHVGKQSDLIFLEKRRRGLSRFVNALERHPVLNADQLVTTFLTVPTEISVWRKQATVTVKEEFEDRYLAADLENSLPQGIDEWMSKTQLALKGAIESFTSWTSLQERVIKRREATSTDLLRYSLSLSTFCEQEGVNCEILGKENGPGIINGLRALSKYHTDTQQLLELECRQQENNLLEDLKRHRDCLVAMFELFARHAKYSGDNVPALEKRIASSKNKLSTLENKPDAKDSDKTKLTTSISEDQNTIVKLMSRRIFIRECVWHELQFFERQQVHISRILNDMAASHVDFAKKHVDVSIALVGDVEGMP